MIQNGMLSSKEAFGPGSLFQIDATLADVNLVSRSNSNQIIGRPVIHVFIDGFTRMVADISVLPDPDACGAEGRSTSD